MADDLTAVEIPIKDFLCDECRSSATSKPCKDDFERFIHEEETREGAKVKVFVGAYHCAQLEPGRFEANFELDLPHTCPTCRIGLVDSAEISKKILLQLLNGVACHPQPLSGFNISLSDPQNEGARISVKGSIICQECWSERKNAGDDLGHCCPK